MKNNRIYKGWEISKNSWNYYEAYNDDYDYYLQAKRLKDVKILIDEEED